MQKYKYFLIHSYINKVDNSFPLSEQGEKNFKDPFIIKIGHKEEIFTARVNIFWKEWN